MKKKPENFPNSSAILSSMRVTIELLTIGSLIPTAVDEERRVRLGLGEPQCQQERGEPRVPSPRSLLQTIERLVEPADHIRTTRVHKSRWLRAVDEEEVEDGAAKA